MKPQKPARNQRVSTKRVRKQQHLLEVSVRRDTLVRQRNRAIVSLACKLVIMTAFTIGAWLGGKELLRRFLWENPDYFLSEIRVTTDGALTREQILSTAGIIAGRNIFTVDLAKARENLDKLPQVERAEIQRVLPNRISVNITERKPIAWVTQKAEDDPTTSEKSFLIDARGIVMKTKTMLPEFLHLPVISGVATENLVAGEKVRTYEMQAAIDLVRFSADNVHFQARSLDLSKGYCVIVTDQARRKVTFGLDRIDQQIDRLERLIAHLETQGREIQTVNLVVERNIPVTFVDQAPDSANPDVENKQKTDTARTPDGLPPAASAREAAAPGGQPTVRRAEAVRPVSPPAPNKKNSSPTNRKKLPVESVKKPFRLNG